MDLKVYYRKIREIEAELPDGDVIVVSLETPNRGRAGVPNEVPKHLAARLLVEGKARLASEEEASAFRNEVREASLEANEAATLSRLQVEIVGERPKRSRKSEKPAADK